MTNISPNSTFPKQQKHTGSSNSPSNQYHLTIRAKRLKSPTIFYSHENASHPTPTAHVHRVSGQSLSEDPRRVCNVFGGDWQKR